jgi:sodium transport system ATP-binding protein
MIEAEKLHRQFGEVVAVEEVSFVARDGQITGLLGPNGAGKTTTLRMIYTLVQPDRGEVRIDGRPIAEDPLAARRRLGVLPDSRGLYPRLTAREHVRYFGQLHGLSGLELEKRVDELVELLDMRGIADRRSQGFSQGERVKVALARALVHKPPNVLLDEPTNGLDVLATRATRELIRRLRAQGQCVVFSSHVMQEVAALCDRMVIISHGRVCAEGTVDELRALAGEHDLEEAFVKLITQGPEARR